MNLSRTISFLIIIVVLLSGCSKNEIKIKNKPKQKIFFKKNGLEYTVEIYDYIFAKQYYDLENKYVIKANLTIKNNSNYYNITNLRNNIRLSLNNMTSEIVNSHLMRDDLLESTFIIIDPGYDKEFRVEWIFSRDLKINSGKDSLYIIMPKSYSIKEGYERHILNPSRF